MRAKLPSYIFRYIYPLLTVYGYRNLPDVWYTSSEIHLRWDTLPVRYTSFEIHVRFETSREDVISDKFSDCDTWLEVGINYRTINQHGWSHQQSLSCTTIMRHYILVLRTVICQISQTYLSLRFLTAGGHYCFLYSFQVTWLVLITSLNLSIVVQLLQKYRLTHYGIELGKIQLAWSLVFHKYDKALPLAVNSTIIENL